MGDLDKNIHRKEKSSSYEEILVPPIEKDKREKEEGYTSLKNTTRTQILATLISCFKKLLLQRLDSSFFIPFFFFSYGQLSLLFS